MSLNGTLQKRRHPINRSICKIDRHFIKCNFRTTVGVHRDSQSESRGGPNRRRQLWHWTPKKKHLYANPSNGGGPGGRRLFGKWEERLQANRRALLKGGKAAVVSNVSMTNSAVREDILGGVDCPERRLIPSFVINFLSTRRGFHRCSSMFTRSLTALLAEPPSSGS